MNYTSVEQSYSLLKLGLDPESSDMCYREMGSSHKGEPFYGILAEPLLPETSGVPAWSVGALLEVMPKFTKPCGIYAVKVAVPQLIKQDKLPIFVSLKHKIMRLRKIRYVADSCPLHRKNCDTCKYCNGTEDSKAYCYYGDKDWQGLY